MPRRVIGPLFVVVAALLTATGCGPNQLDDAAKEIARLTGASADDIARAAEREAAVGNTSADDRSVAADLQAGRSAMVPLLIIKPTACAAVAP